jgi:phage tail sheath protein FI
MATYRTPGVYVEEISTLPPSVAEVATAVPAFIGYTETGPADTDEPEVVRVATMLEFKTAFGGPKPFEYSVTLPDNSNGSSTGNPSVQMVTPAAAFSLYYAMSHYFKNGGGPCYVASVGNYTSSPSKARFSAGLAALEKEDEPTLIMLTDAACLLSGTGYYDLCSEALAQCSKLGDRFTILDVAPDDSKKDWQGFRDNPSLSINLSYGAAYTPFLKTTLNYAYSEDNVKINRPSGSEDTAGASVVQTNWTRTFGADGSSENGLLVSYSGANRAPRVKIIASGSSITFEEDSGDLVIRGTQGKTGAQIADAWTALDDAGKVDGFDVQGNGDGSGGVDHTDNSYEALEKEVDSDAGTTEAGNTMASLVRDANGDPVAEPNTGLYNQIKAMLAEQRVVLPPSAAVAGIYARVDREQGVWKAPANTGVLGVLGPAVKITDDDQDRLNVDPTAGKSINAIRAFTGKGTLVWGARTLAGNDNEWRYVSVRRLFIMIEESTRKASAFAVFEPNDQSTWLKVKAMIESYLYGLWQQGALAGPTPEAAYYVNVGLGTTMTPQDVLEGRMIVEIGVAAVRPAEFIILRFSHKMQTA